MTTTPQSRVAQAPDRLPPRRMLALIALADLPTPESVAFYSETGLALSFGRLADGQAWSRFLEGSTGTYTYNGRVVLDEGRITWHGWRVQLHAVEDLPPVPAFLDEDLAARLTSVVGGAG